MDLNYFHTKRQASYGNFRLSGKVSFLFSFLILNNFVHAATLLSSSQMIFQVTTVITISLADLITWFQIHNYRNTFKYCHFHLMIQYKFWSLYRVRTNYLKNFSRHKYELPGSLLEMKDKPKMPWGQKIYQNQLQDQKHG